jgi:multidrug efflux pump subunit AcrA (membrane-fusion protein)
VDIDKSSLAAPYDATVVLRHYDEGQIVAPGQAVLTIQEFAAPEVRIGVAGDFAAALAVGDEQDLLIDDREVRAMVRSILPRRNPATRTVDIIFSLADENGAMPGDLARLSLEETISENGYWLPISALAEGGRGLWTAYVAVPLERGAVESTGATHILEPRAVEILYEDTSQVFVRGALAPDDRFVTGGLQRVVPNQQVRLHETVTVSAQQAR